MTTRFNSGLAQVKDWDELTSALSFTDDELAVFGYRKVDYASNQHDFFWQLKKGSYGEVAPFGVNPFAKFRPRLAGIEVVHVRVFFGDFSGYADGERRGLDQIGG